MQEEKKFSEIELEAMKKVERDILEKEALAVAMKTKVIVVIDEVQLSVPAFKEVASRFAVHCNHPFERYKKRNYYYFDFVSPFGKEVTIRVKHYERYRRDFILKAL
jgi:hypothetical protein